MGHTRGISVDLTIATKIGEELPMLSVFDDCTKKANEDHLKSSFWITFAKEPREILRSLMKHINELAFTLNQSSSHKSMMWKRVDFLLNMSEFSQKRHGKFYTRCEIPLHIQARV